ncbi:MAG: hypothetical protein ACRYGL_18605 [Janthinobacterium lividum]
MTLRKAALNGQSRSLSLSIDSTAGGISSGIESIGDIAMPGMGGSPPMRMLSTAMHATLRQEVA